MFRFSPSAKYALQMKRIFTLCLMAVFAVCACECMYAQSKPQPDPTTQDWAKFYRYEKANAEVLASGVRPDVVFMGNSITQNWAKFNPDFFTKNNFLGRGIGGQTTSHMLVRFRRDVIELNPRAVAKLHDIKVILCSVTPAVRFRWRPNVTFSPADEIIRLNVMIKEYADANKIPYVDYHSALVDERKGLKQQYHKDEVHPFAICYAEVMEPMILKVINKVLHTKHTYTTPIPKI